MTRRGPVQPAVATQDQAPVILLGALALVGLLLFAASMLTGPVALTPAEAWRALAAEDRSLAAVILTEVRLPRALLGAAVGATLGLAGAALQGLLRNPLAEPGIIGVSGSAGLGAVLAFYSGLGALHPLTLPAGGMAGAAVAVLGLHVLAGREASVLTLILAGVAINSLAAALTTLALNLAPNPYASLELFFWLLGSLADRSLDHVMLALPPMVLGGALLIGQGRALDALTLGEDVAASLGVNLAAVRLGLVTGTALAVGAAVAVTGAVAFVGLIVPHLLRPLVGHQPSRLLAASTLGGAALVLAADILVRLVPTGVELKLGVVTALMGAPFFLHLVVRTRRALT